jgi:hypothetical protein
VSVTVSEVSTLSLFTPTRSLDPFPSPFVLQVSAHLSPSSVQQQLSRIKSFQW